MNEPGEVLEKVLRNRKEESGIELKRSIELVNVDRDEVEKNSVAVANSALPNPFGWIIFGIDNKTYNILGTVDLTGRKYLPDDVIETRSQQFSQIAAQINPPLNHEWLSFQYSGQRLIAIRIDSRGYGHWYSTSKGGVFYRLGGHTYVAHESTIRRWVEEQQRRDEEKVVKRGSASKIDDLLEKVHSREVPLSRCFVDALKLASSVGDQKLESFCRHELNGWSEELLNEASSYRRLEVYLSIDQVNTSYMGWTSAHDVMNFMMRNPDRFTPQKIAYAQPISKIEALLPTDTRRDYLATITMPLTEFVPKSEIPKSIDPDRSLVFAYTTMDSIISLVESIRVELSKRLLELT